MEHANAVLAIFCADYNRRFARRAADSARDFRTLPRRFDLARCLGFRYQRIVSANHVITLGRHTLTLPPRAGQRSYTRDTVDRSHQLDGTLHDYRGDQLLLTQSLPLQEHADRRPASRTTAQKRKLPPIYNLSGRPPVAAVT